ncbi:MAG: type II toxin-antitoxin system PemK/MazF family toxin [Thermoplasmata archaeon]|nr:type II toxin-antitoxin system PemK/MazF family toxin [Thermoplasmata archaeon]
MSPMSHKLKGDVWSVDIPEGRGHEQKGQRPAIVVGSANGLVTVIPLTGNIERAKFSHTDTIEPTDENGLSSTSVALVFQVKSLDEDRFIRRIGRVSGGDIERIDALMADLLGLRTR